MSDIGDFLGLEFVFTFFGKQNIITKGVIISGIIALLSFTLVKVAGIKNIKEGISLVFDGIKSNLLLIISLVFLGILFRIQLRTLYENVGFDDNIEFNNPQFYYRIVFGLFISMVIGIVMDFGGLTDFSFALFGE